MTWEDLEDAFEVLETAGEYDGYFCSIKDRVRVVEYVEEGRTLAQTAAVFKVHIGTVIAWRKCYRTTGSVERKIRRPVNKKIILEKLVDYVDAHPDAYLKEIAEVFDCCPASVLKRLRKLGITRKKSAFTKSRIPKNQRRIWRKLKTLPKKSSYMLMKPTSKRRCIVNMPAVLEANGLICASALLQLSSRAS